MNRLKWAILAFATAVIMADIGITAWFWHYETNPLALELGMVLFLAVKLAMVLPFIAVFVRYHERLPRVTLGYGLVVGNVYLAVLLANVLVLAGWIG